VFKRIVVALDGSAASQDALALARRMAEPEGGSLTGVHVVEMRAGRGAGYPVHPDEDEIRARIGEWIEATKRDGVDVDLQEHQVVMGGPPRSSRGSRARRAPTSS
jgi:nucleotide-binding universal stress UspA family protein